MTTERKCALGVCRFLKNDEEGLYCSHPKSFAIAPIFGASPNKMSRAGLCCMGYTDPDKNTLELFEPVDERPDLLTGG